MGFGTRPTTVQPEAPKVKDQAEKVLFFKVGYCPSPQGKGHYLPFDVYFTGENEALKSDLFAAFKELSGYIGSVDDFIYHNGYKFTYREGDEPEDSVVVLNNEYECVQNDGCDFGDLIKEFMKIAESNGYRLESVETPCTFLK
jgi:hypothetical protein